MSTSNQRIAYIRSHYKLEQVPGGWRAQSLRTDGTVFAEYTRPTRDAVCYTARCQWGHFNFEDEARAFKEIFG
jgi:hypothetical protein